MSFSLAKFKVIVLANFSLLYLAEQMCFILNIYNLLQETLEETNRDMPVNLKDKAAFCVLGLSAADPGKGSKKKSDQGCGCYRITEPLESCRQLAVGSNSWIQLMHNSCSGYQGENLWLPEVHHIHWKGEVVYHCYVHVCKL